MTEDGEEADPVQVDQLFEKWVLWGHGMELWHYTVDLDWRAMLRARRKQIVYLGRYGRQDILKLKHRPLTEIAEFTRYLTEIVEAENVVEATNEQ